MMIDNFSRSRVSRLLVSCVAGAAILLSSGFAAAKEAPPPDPFVGVSDAPVSSLTGVPIASVDVDGPFEASALPEAKLGDLRGGFISMGVIDYFEVELRASVDGVELYNYDLADLTANTVLTETIPGSSGPKATSTVSRDADRLMTVVQVGPNNVVNGINPASGSAAFDGARGFFNVVQNTLSGVVIRQDATFRIGLNDSMLGSMTAARGLTDSFSGTRALTMR